MRREKERRVGARVGSRGQRSPAVKGASRVAVVRWFREEVPQGWQQPRQRPVPGILHPGTPALARGTPAGRVASLRRAGVAALSSLSAWGIIDRKPRAVQVRRYLI